MTRSRFAFISCAVLLLGAPAAIHADMQVIAPGTGLESAIVVDTGADGICNTTAAVDDIQAIPVGTAPPFQPEVRCGTNKVVDTAAQGDDTQLLPVGASCKNPNVVVIDTGKDGVANTPANNANMATGDDVQLVTVGAVPPNLPCVLTGPNGKADTTASGDDVQDLTVGTVEANTNVILCGPNLVADTHANNDLASGQPADDVQVVAVGSSCPNSNTVVVTSGPDGISGTRAEGPDFVVKALGPRRITIAKGKQAVSKTVKVRVSNVEFGTSAPASRTYTLSVTDGSCPTGTVSSIDANAATSAPGLQASASVPKGGKVTGSFVVTFRPQDYTSVATNVPFRCAVNVEADSIDTPGAPDDAANPANNATSIDFEVVDKNDLP